VLGSASEADDAVQEAWLRLNRTDTSDVENLRAWLTTVVSRICLDMLRSRASRREAPWPDDAPRTEPAAPGPGPATQAEEADAVGSALLLVLDTLTPSERLAFVLHDMFAVPFDEVAPVVGKSVDATRQLASRARRRVRGGGDPEPDLARQREVVEAFLAASREGRFERLLTILDPDVVLRADPAAVAAAQANVAHGAPELEPELVGAHAVAQAFVGRAQAARVALLDGVVGAAYAPGDRVRTAFAITVRDGRIVAIDLVADPDELSVLDVELLS
jgi:RNA polymerase sigma-70 factor (ECF subfamily)